MGEEEKKPAEEKKAAEDDNKSESAQEIILRVFMHCEGCARKVRRCLKGFQGVEDVITDCRTSKVVVKGEKADPLKVLERIQRKSHRQVELISPLPPPPPPREDPQKPPEKELVKSEDKKEQDSVITVVLGVYMHCEACAREIKNRIMRMKGVESAEPDLKSSQVIVKGVFEPGKLTEYVHKSTGKHAAIVKVEPQKKEEEKGKDEKKPEEGNKEAAKKGDEDGKDRKEGGSNDGGSSGEPPAEPADAEAESKLELKKEEYNYNPYHTQNQNQNQQLLLYNQRFVQEMNAYPPQMFSDENPNACSVM